MNHQKRRPFRPRTNKNNFRGRSNGSRIGGGGHFQSNSNGNSKFSRNGSMSNPFNVEKTIQKFQQLAKDAQSMGDPVLVENYLQHADHYSRRLTELNLRSKPASEEKKENENHNTVLTDKKDITSNKDSILEKQD
jgi:hypothetical protein|tara:strand:+ start:549 stop:953 length:405 start_codon:yes stop_codon:yes gene_type:complete